MDTWVRTYAAGLASAATPASPVRWVTTPSGARLAFVGGAVLKLHHERTEDTALTARVRAACESSLATVFVPPLTSEVVPAPDGSLVTAWPEVRVLGVSDTIPWPDVGTLLARLHRLPAPTTLPPHVPSDRLGRAVERARNLPDEADRGLLVQLGERLLREVLKATDKTKRAQRHTTELTAPQMSSVVHGDFHLGQVGGWEGDWRLLDLDDVGVGDPAWDLARPAGFWAAGLVGDREWEEFLDGYRDAGGPAVPATGDPWPPLDLAARCAVHIAAVRVLSRPVHSDLTADALLAACRRM
ncbi:MAG TPA: aminoglycoside phosphotransferase family protein [Intrasporangium sp.]|nr:aminoglycoside phosphotransferase family protein [Intrasporangium sp.]